MIKQAKEAYAVLDSHKTQLKTFVKDETKPLKERFEHLVVLHQVGGAHSDWAFQGWNRLEANPLKFLHLDRYQTYDLLDFIDNFIEEMLTDEWYKGHVDFVKTTELNIPLFTWLAFYEKDPSIVALVEAMCDNATLSFTYEW